MVISQILRPTATIIITTESVAVLLHFVMTIQGRRIIMVYASFGQSWTEWTCYCLKSRACDYDSSELDAVKILRAIVFVYSLCWTKASHELAIEPPS